MIIFSLNVCQTNGCVSRVLVTINFFGANAGGDAKHFLEVFCEAKKSVVDPADPAGGYCYRTAT